MDKNKISGAISKIKLEKIAEDRAKELGYYKSDKTQFDTTPWCEHNIFVRGWKDGYNYHKQESEGLREWIDCKERMPDVGVPVYAVVQHWNSKNQRQVILHHVKESDCLWRCSDDNSEVSYDWTVTHWLPQKPLPSPPHLNKANEICTTKKQ